MCSFNNLQASQDGVNESCKYYGSTLNDTQSQLILTGQRQLQQEEELAQILRSQMQILERSSPRNDKMNDQNPNDIQLALVPVKKVKKSKIKKEKLTKKLFKIHTLLNNSQQSKQQQLYSNKPEYIFRLIPSRKIFFLSGDIFVEVQDKTQPDLLNGTIFNEFRNICQIEKNAISVSFKIESMKPMKVLNEVIYELENSQNQENYDEAQVMKQYQDTIVILQEKIQSVIDFYSACPDDLLRLIAEREAFMLQEKKKILKQISQNDEFSLIGSLMLSFVNKTTTISHISISRPSVALIGGEDEEILEYCLRSGFLNLFNYASRKNIFNVFIQIQERDLIHKQSTDADKNLVFWFPQFEIYSLDQIKIVCNCEITQVQIQYPPQLHFQGSDCQLLNQLESFFVVHFDITQRHIEMLMQLRQGQFSSQLVNMRDTLEVSSLEYDIKGQIFLEKYYKEYYEQIKTKGEEQKIKERAAIIEYNRISCKYRQI